MCVRREKMPLWLRLDYLALVLLLMPRVVDAPQVIRLWLGAAGAVVLAAAIVLMFVECKRNGGMAG